MKRSLVATATLIMLILIAGCSGGDKIKTTPGGGTIDPPPVTYQQVGLYKLSGICFGPYPVGNPNYGDIVSEADIRRYLGPVAANFYGGRSYGSTNGMEKFAAIAKSLGLKVAAGAWLGSEKFASGKTANEKEIANLIAACRAGNVDIAIVGNEVLLNNTLTEDQLLGYIAQVKATGVTVTFAEEWATLVAHPRVIAACDVIMANVYPYWEGVSIDGAITKLQEDYDQIKAASGTKKVIISETGWPSAGSQYGAAIPSPQNQATYFGDFVGWAKGQSVDFYYFEMYDEAWKTAEPGGVGVHWGLWDASMSLKSGCVSGFNATATATGGGGSTDIPFTYVPIAGVPQAINDLGKLIAQQQRNEVTPGGSEMAPGYSSYDQSLFDGSDKLAKIVAKVKASQTFKNGVASLKTLPSDTQNLVFAAYAKPLYPTWGMNGHIGSDGTTDAGYAVEGEIATAMTNAVKNALAAARAARR